MYSIAVALAFIIDLTFVDRAIGVVDHLPFARVLGRVSIEEKGLEWIRDTVDRHLISYSLYSGADFEV